MGKVWNVGDVLTAADLNAWALPLTAIKASDTSRTSTTTLTADPDLVVAIAANASYRFWCFLNFEGAATGTGDIKWNFPVPAGATLRYQVLADLTSGGGGVSPLQAGLTSTGTTVNTAASNGAGSLTTAGMWGTLVVAGTAGSITLNWAQNTSSGTSTILHAQSALTLDRIA